MKKTIGFIALFLLMLAFTGCEKDKTLAELVVGKWEIKSLKMVVYENNVKTDEAISYYTAGEEAIEILGDGTGKHFTNGTQDDSFTWTLTGTTMTIILATETMDLEVTVKGDIITYMMTQTEVVSAITYKYEMTYTAQKIASK